MVDKDSYKAIYDQAMQELADLIAERDSLDERRDGIDKRLAEVRKGAIALGPLCGQNPTATAPEWFPEVNILRDMGITDAIRKVFEKYSTALMSPVTVRDSLKEVGYEIKSKNILQSVHTVLRRLKDAGEIEPEDHEGSTWYRRKQPDPPPPRRYRTIGTNRPIFTLPTDFGSAGKKD